MSFLEIENEKAEYIPCKICSNVHIHLKYNKYIERIGVRYEKIFEETIIMTNSGRDILKCPYIEDNVESTICLNDAIQKLGMKVNVGIPWDSPDYIRPCLSQSYQETEQNLTLCYDRKTLHINM